MKHKSSSELYINIRKEVLKLSLLGQTRDEIAAHLVEKYGYKTQGAMITVRRALDSQVEKFEKYKQKIADENFKRLNYIIDDCIERGNNKDALNAIDKLNKMGGIYVQKVEVNSEKPVFEIKVQQ